MIQCDEVTIKFTALHHNSQRIRALEVPGANFIQVEAGPLYIVLSYVHEVKATGVRKLLKSVTFNASQVHEFACEGSVKYET